jgi:hypothetical protein
MADTLARMRQMVGTTAQWAADDIVIGDGELVCERTTGGAIKMKVGDGVSNFSELPYLGGLVPAFGEDYSWQTVTGSRSDNTDYMSPDYPIQVNFVASFLTNSGSAALVVGGVSIAAVGNAGLGQVLMTISGIVPPATVYRVNTSLLDGRAWLELRI